MTAFNKIEKRVFQLLVVILAIVCFVPGGASAFGGLNGSAALFGGEAIFGADSVLRGFADNQYRFGFGVFFAQGLVLLFFLSNIHRHANLFRVAGLALFVGGLGRLSNILEYGVVDSQVIGPTAIELVIVPLLMLWHLRINRQQQAA